MNTEMPGKVISIPTGVRECLFAVTNNSGIAGEREGDGWGNMMSLASRMRVALPGEGSGSSKTFQFIQSINEKLGRVKNIKHFDSADEAINAVALTRRILHFSCRCQIPEMPCLKKLKRKIFNELVLVIDLC